MLRSLFGRVPSTSLQAFNIRRFSILNTLSKEHQLPPRPKILESDITESFLRGTGPGGQKINKTSSAVQLKHLPTGIVVKSQECRSRELNRKYARQILAEKLDVLEKGDQSRSAIKAERARSKKASAEKKKRRKYRKLADEAEAEAEETEDGVKLSKAEHGDASEEAVVAESHGRDEDRELQDCPSKT